MISAVVLAAGTSSRMGRAKPLVRVARRSFLERVLATVRASVVEDVVVVLGHEADRVQDEVLLDGATAVTNPRYAEGMSTSIRAGLRALGPEAEGTFIVLVDQPFLHPSTLDAVVHEWREAHPPILIPTFRGVRGNPVFLDRAVFEAVQEITGDRGCRSIFGDYEGKIVEVPVHDSGVLLDIDTEDQLERVAHHLDGGEALEALALELHQEGEGHLPSAAGGHGHLGASIADDPVDLAGELRERGEPFVLATVVRAIRPTSGKPGFKALIRPNGEMTGWIGGACSQSIVVAESLAAMRDGSPRLISFSPDPSKPPPRKGVIPHPLACESGGEMEVFLEPDNPVPQLLIVGESPLGRALTVLGHLLGFRVAVAALGAREEQHPEADLIIPDVEQLAEVATPSTYAVVASMGRYDERALRRLLASPAPYVGLVASRRRAGALLEKFRREGISEDNLARVRNPAGLDLSARTQEEIALSIVAEITQVRRRHRRTEETTQASEAPEEAAVDPVCGMTVDPATSLHAEFDETTYSFCSEGCQARFLEDPASYTG